jgi:hypothetical protein
MPKIIKPVYSDYFRWETHDPKELLENLIDFLTRLNKAGVYECDIDYSVAYGYVEVGYSVTVEEARKLGYDDADIATLIDPDHDEKEDLDADNQGKE